MQANQAVLAQITEMMQWQKQIFVISCSPNAQTQRNMVLHSKLLLGLDKMM